MQLHCVHSTIVGEIVKGLGSRIAAVFIVTAVFVCVVLAVTGKGKVILNDILAKGDNAEVQDQPQEQPPDGQWGTQPLPDKHFNGFSPVQQRNASIIVRVGREMQMPERALLVATMTALQECRLHNCANNNPAYPEVVRISQSLPHEGESDDHDSVGLFQQRPIEGGEAKKWGHVKDLMNPSYAAKRFYEELAKVSGWEKLALGEAAQAVQRSKYPERYAKHESNAKMLVAHVQKYKPA